jgi:hypothetical protein
LERIRAPTRSQPSDFRRYGECIAVEITVFEGCGRLDWLCAELMNPFCPLCSASEAASFHQDKRREYLRCSVCRLIFVPESFHLPEADERAVYDLHQNSPDDHAYRAFLNRLSEPVATRLNPRSRGLDFGSGPGPTLSVMFEELGHMMAIYDPFYAPDTSVLATQYDFVTASEVVEHFRNPTDDLHRLWSCVKPGGILGIMTKLALNRAAFERWHYTHDQTHVSFFSRETFEWLATRWKARLNFVGHDVILLTANVG